MAETNSMSVVITIENMMICASINVNGIIGTGRSVKNAKKYAPTASKDSLSSRLAENACCVDLILMENAQQYLTFTIVTLRKNCLISTITLSTDTACLSYEKRLPNVTCYALTAIGWCIGIGMLLTRRTPARNCYFLRPG